MLQPFYTLDADYGRLYNVIKQILNKNERKPNGFGKYHET